MVLDGPAVTVGGSRHVDEVPSAAGEDGGDSAWVMLGILHPCAHAVDLSRGG